MYPRPAAMPTLKTLRKARAHQDAVRRWFRPVAPIVVVLLALSALQSGPGPGLHGPGLRVLLAVVTFTVGALGAMASRRARIRIQVVFISMLFAGAIVLQPTGTGAFGLVIGLALAGPYFRRRRSRVLAALSLAVLGILATAAMSHSSPVPALLAGISVCAFIALASLAGQLREANEQAELLLVELEQTREAYARAAALGERQRLAREVHDVLAHSLSGLVIQIDAAQMLAAGADTRLTRAIERAQHLARTGLEETRQAIGMLRGDALPGPELLGTLIEEFRHDTGIDCRLTITGQERPLTPQTRLAVYRVTQEALTNVAKHDADPKQVTVHLAFQAGATHLTVENITARGAPPPPPRDCAGHGLTGMRERAELLGGTLHAALTEQGFRVELQVPG